MAQRLHRLLLVPVLILAIGGHWAVLQSVAWIGMIVDYSQSDSLPRALVKTFDGTSPCKLCRFVAEGKASEKKSDTATQASQKLDLFVSEESPVFRFEENSAAIIGADPFLPSRNDPTPVPPPKTA